MDKKILEEIGLSKNQSKIYITLSNLGSSTANEISKISKLHRTNIYEALDKLVNLGLVSYILKSDVKYFQITEPENLLNLIKDKVYRIKQIIPELKIRSELQEQKGEAQVFYGVKSFQQILENFLTYNDDILVFGIPRRAPDKMKYYIEGFHKRRAKKRILMKHIYNFKAIDRIKYLNKLNYCEAKYLPQKFDSTVSTCICGNEVVFVGWSEPVWTIQIINKDISNSYKNYFNLLWDFAMKP